MDFEREIAYSFRSGKAEGLAEGFAEGEEKKAVEASIELLKENVSPEVIAKCVKLPLEKVLELKEQITVKA